MVLVREAHEFRSLPQVRILDIIATTVYIMRSHAYLRISCVYFQESDGAGAQSPQVPQFHGRPKP